MDRNRDAEVSQRDVLKHNVATPTQFGELFSAFGAIVVWCAFMLPQGATVAFESLWLLLIGLLLAGWTLLMRLRYSQARFEMTIGLWHRGVALSELESISWKRTGGGRSRGTIYVRDRAGHKVPVYVERFNRRSEWGPLLLDAANRCGAAVDQHSRSYLDGSLPEGALVH